MSFSFISATVLSLSFFLSSYLIFVTLAFCCCFVFLSAQRFSSYYLAFCHFIHFFLSFYFSFLLHFTFCSLFVSHSFHTISIQTKCAYCYNFCASYCWIHLCFRVPHGITYKNQPKQIQITLHRRMEDNNQKKRRQKKLLHFPFKYCERIQCVCFFCYCCCKRRQYLGFFYLRFAVFGDIRHV